MSTFLQDKKEDQEVAAAGTIEEEEKPSTKKEAASSGLSCKMFEHKLAHVLYVAGNSALKFLMHCDKIEEYLNKRRIEAENNKTKEAQIEKNDNEDKDIDKINGGFEAEYEEH